MSIFHLARRLPGNARAVIAALLLVFALNSVAEAAHTHERSTTAAAHTVLCGYCATFANIADAPAVPALIAPTAHVSFASIECGDHIYARRLITSAQARAPPVS